MSDEQKTSKKSLRRELIEWALILGIPLVLWLTGLHTEVLGRVQQVVLWTGLIQPDVEVPAEEQETAGYNMQLLSMDGDTRIGLEAFRGKVIFLNYWATWCPPCIAEMPNIQSLYEEYRDDDRIQFLLVSLDEDREKARSFIQRKEFTFPVYYLASRRPKSLQSTVIPTTYVIDRNGRIATSRRGMANYNTERFKEFLDELLSGTADPASYDAGD